jgi:hypothetical protein
MKITRRAFVERFSVHLPTGVPSAWVKGTQYVFVDESAEIEELERMMEGSVYLRSPFFGAEE